MTISDLVIKGLVEHLQHRELDVGYYDYDDPESETRHYKFEAYDLFKVINEYLNK